MIQPHVPDHVRGQMLDWLAEIGRTQRTQTIPVNHIREIENGYRFTYFGVPGVEMLYQPAESMISLESEAGRLDARPLRPPEHDPKAQAARLVAAAMSEADQSVAYLTQAVLLAAGLIEMVEIK